MTWGGLVDPNRDALDESRRLKDLLLSVAERLSKHLLTHCDVCGNPLSGWLALDSAGRYGHYDCVVKDD